MLVMMMVVVVLVVDDGDRRYARKVSNLALLYSQSSELLARPTPRNSRKGGMKYFEAFYSVQRLAGIHYYEPASPFPLSSSNLAFLLFYSSKF